MAQKIMVEINPEEVIEAVKKMTKKERESFIEDLLAETSPEYLKSIREARADYKAGRVSSYKDIFNE
jgi:Mg/Co/Ni transporter MgtE